MEPLRKQICALVPSEREKICLHKHVAWSGRVPCTGHLQCSMCGQIFLSREQLEQQRMAATYGSHFDSEGNPRDDQ